MVSVLVVDTLEANASLDLPGEPACRVVEVESGASSPHLLLVRPISLPLGSGHVFLCCAIFSLYFNK